jgi:hypothetical protein
MQLLAVCSIAHHLLSRSTKNGKLLATPRTLIRLSFKFKPAWICLNARTRGDKHMSRYSPNKVMQAARSKEVLQHVLSTTLRAAQLSTPYLDGTVNVGAADVYDEAELDATDFDGQAVPEATTLVTGAPLATSSQFFRHFVPKWLCSLM